jgi:predicted metal-dependent enzyme (double-stranded beta helix superfamily)
MNQYLESFVQCMDELVASTNDSTQIAAETEKYLADLVSHPEFLEERFREPASDRYRQHVVHVHPEGRYSVVSLVWRPGQETPIHDHRCWCVVGVLDGRETENRYDLYQDSETRVLRITNQTNYHPGEVCALVPPLEDIHKVANGDPDGLTISIHIYGDDIAKAGSSINHIFEYPVVTSLPANAKPVSWREVLVDDSRAFSDRT